MQSIIRKYENDGVAGLRALFHESAVSLAERYGNPTGQGIYSSRGDLLSLYRGKHSETEWLTR